jgi:glycosyltransferase involved in cell wall biosynthesis
MNKKLIAYVGVFPFPFGQAASKRVLGNLMLLQDLGYNVIVGHGGGAKEGVYNNINHYGLNELFSDSRGLVRLFNIIFRGGNNTVKWLSELEVKPEYVVVYGGYYHFSKRILKYCQTNNIKVIFDLVEWYEPSQMMGGRYGLFYNSFLLAFKYVYPRADGIITISSSLRDVFNKKKTVVIPPLVAIEMNEPFISESNMLSLIYAGNIGNKDSLYEIIQVVDQFSIDNEIKLDIFGPSEVELKLKYNIQELPASIRIHGKVKQEEINSFIAEADFTIFTRPDIHCNRYGFPSKFVESLSLGVPVATNLTSDIGLYLRDGHNGFIIEDNSKQAIETVIRKMLLLSPAQKMAMKKNAIKTAEDNFSSTSLPLRESVSKFFTDIYEE